MNGIEVAGIGPDGVVIRSYLSNGAEDAAGSTGKSAKTAVALASSLALRVSATLAATGTGIGAGLVRSLVRSCPRLLGWADCRAKGQRSASQGGSKNNASHLLPPNLLSR